VALYRADVKRQRENTAVVRQIPLREQRLQCLFELVTVELRRFQYPMARGRPVALDVLIHLLCCIGFERRPFYGVHT